MCLVCLVSLQLLAIHIADLPPNIIIGASSVTISGSLFNNSLINNLDFAKVAPEVHASLYLLSGLYCASGPVTRVTCSIVLS